MDLLNPSNPYVAGNLVLLLVLVLLSTIFFVCFSGFVKYSIVLNIIKNAVGTQQIPPSIVINLLAALLALNTIWPDLEPGIARIKPYFSSFHKGVRQSLFSDVTSGPPKQIGSQSSATGKKNNQLYYIISHLFDYFPEMFKRAKRKTDELKELIDIPINFDAKNDTFKFFLGNLILDLYQGFELGLKMYMIFVSIDFLVAVILSGVGMSMLSPTVISTPIKLAVFYFSDSWTILFRVLD